MCDRVPSSTNFLTRTLPAGVRHDAETLVFGRKEREVKQRGSTKKIHGIHIVFTFSTATVPTIPSKIPDKACAESCHSTEKVGREEVYKQAS